MENASKALIIAGAILLSILIISLGLIVFNQAKQTVGNANLSEAEITSFNAQFTSYEGESVSGTVVNALIEKVYSSNVTNAVDKTGKYITLTYPGKDGTSCTITVTNDAVDGDTTVKVRTGVKYTVSSTKSATTGLIETITVTQN